jgi:hypothetical protein
MLLWFVALSCAGVLLVFGDPSIDFRMVALGSLVPDLVDGVLLQGAGPAHTLLSAVSLMTVSMLATIGRRVWRKRLLMVAIGVFAHLVLDGVWSNPSLFWWPLVTGGLNDRLPVVDRGPVVVIVQEAIGAAVAVWFARRVRLDTAERRRSFMRTGRVAA